VEENEEGESQKDMIPIPENMDLGLDKRGTILNNSNRRNHCFGVGRVPIFPREKREKGEGKNWTATFTRSGCMACKGEDGTPNHKGKGGEPLIVVIGDDSIPSVVGHTRKGEEGGCAWVFKKEMLRLEEVPEILRKLDQEKKGWDLEGKRRPHKFFVPNGSKILVGSYAHLRRMGLEAYIEAFNTSEREVFRVTGDIGVEVLPVIPVVFEDMDRLGRELVKGLVHWVEWIGGMKGRESIKELAGTGGRTRGSEECRVQYTQSFASMQNRQW
jgi:hypothetical protein